LKDKQTAGYPRFETPGVVSGYYIASWIPSLKEVSYGKSTQLMGATTGDFAVTAASALAATMLSLIF